MSPELSNLISIINGYSNAKDFERVFTYIQFIKEFNFQNNSQSFIRFYKEYLSTWALVKKRYVGVDSSSFVFQQMLNILKSITLNYSSYEQQSFLANINLSNKSHLKAICALYSRKIKEITDFYKRKREEMPIIFKKNSERGSTKSVQQIIFDKILDFVFTQNSGAISYQQLKKDLNVSMQAYVDNYSQYFDIPRKPQLLDKTRTDEMLSANINQFDYRVYLQIQLVIAELIYSGDVMLQEIPLIAQLGMDFSQSCVGDMLALKNSLVANTTINQVSLDQQVALKRKLYQKYIGCDLFYLYVDLQGNITVDKLCQAKNPTGNLLNCGSPDTATTYHEQLELLSNIGLFFKPDKNSILKINAKDYTWTIDTDNITQDTMYIFPDPNKYGDIGNSKSQSYPIIMEYKFDYDIKNESSGFSKNDPILTLTDQGWYSYYSKQSDDFKTIDNKNWQYALTNLANYGYLENYQQDMWGNHFGIFKGCYLYYNSLNNLEKIQLVKNYSKTRVNRVQRQQDDENNQSSNSIAGRPILINGGYFTNPLKQNKNYPFNFRYKLRFNESYNWSGVAFKNSQFHTSDKNNNWLNFGLFTDASRAEIEYIDHFRFNTIDQQNKNFNQNVINNSSQTSQTINLSLFPQQWGIYIQTVDRSWEQLSNQKGNLYIKLNYGEDSTIRPFSDAFNWLENYGVWQKDSDILNFTTKGNVLILETTKNYYFIPYNYDGNEITNALQDRQLLYIPKISADSKLLYNESRQMFYLLLVQKMIFDDRAFLFPRIYSFDYKRYIVHQLVNVCDSYLKYPSEGENEVKDEIIMLEKINNLNVYHDFEEQIITKYGRNGLKKYLFGNLEKSNLEKDKKEWISNLKNLFNFEIPFYCCEMSGNVQFAFNSTFNKFLICFSLVDNNGTPYIVEHSFKLQQKTHSDLRIKVYQLGHLLNTLDSYIYSIKGNGISYMYNDNIENQVSKNVYPNDSVASFDEIVIFEDKEKWTYYESDDFTFNPNENVKVYLKQLDNDKKELSKNDYSLSKTIFRIHGYEKENGQILMNFVMKGSFKIVYDGVEYSFSPHNIKTETTKTGSGTYTTTVHLIGGGDFIKGDNIFKINFEIRQDKLTIQSYYLILTIYEISGNLNNPNNKINTQVISSVYKVTFEVGETDVTDQYTTQQDSSRSLQLKMVYSGIIKRKPTQYKINVAIPLNNCFTYNIGQEKVPTDDSALYRLYSGNTIVDSQQMTVTVKSNGEINGDATFILCQVDKNGNKIIVKDNSGKQIIMKDADGNLLENKINVALHGFITDNNILLNSVITAKVYIKGCQYPCYMSIDLNGGIVSYNMNQLKNGSNMFINKPLGEKISQNMALLTNGQAMFYTVADLEYSTLKTVDASFPKLVQGRGMFGGNIALQSFTSKLPELSKGRKMFQQCYALRTFSVDLPKLIDGNRMFAISSKDKVGLKNFNSNLSSLQKGFGMFRNTNLTPTAVKNIADKIKDLSDIQYDYSNQQSCEKYNASVDDYYVGRTSRVITIDVDTSYKHSEYINHFAKIAKKGWVISTNLSNLDNDYVGKSIDYVVDENEIEIKQHDNNKKWYKMIKLPGLWMSVNFYHQKDSKLTSSRRYFVMQNTRCLVYKNGINPEHYDWYQYKSVKQACCGVKGNDYQQRNPQYDVNDTEWYKQYVDQNWEVEPIMKKSCKYLKNSKWYNGWYKDLNGWALEQYNTTEKEILED